MILSARATGRWRRTAAALFLAGLTGCAVDTRAVLVGLPDDLAGAAPAAVPDGPASPAVEGFDGYYRGALEAVAPAAPLCVGFPAPVPPAPVPRDMLVRDGRATFGVNLPFTGLVGPDGSVLLRYVHVGSLDGRFADGRFEGTLAADDDPGCRWAVGMAKVIVGVPPFTGVRPEPVDAQGGHLAKDEAPLPETTALAMGPMRAVVSPE